MPLLEISKFEKNNNLSVNINVLDNENNHTVNPLRISKDCNNTKDCHWDLIYLLDPNTDNFLLLLYIKFQ